MTNKNPQKPPEPVELPEYPHDCHEDLAKLKAVYESKISELSQALDYHNIFVFELSKKHELEYYNTSFSEWLETNKYEQPTLHNHIKSEFPFLPQEFYSKLENVWKSGSSSSIILNLNIKGTIFKVKLLFSPKPGSNGESTIAVSFSELSSLRNILPGELKFNRVLINLLKKLDFHILLCGLNGELILFNQAAENFFLTSMSFQLAEGDIIANNLDDEDFKKIWKENEEYCLAGNESRFLSSVKIKSKSYQFEFSFFPFKTNDRITGYSILAKDITDVSRMEKKLFLSEERYCDLVEKAEIGIAFDNTRGEITFFNEKFCELFGYTLNEMMGKSHNDLVDPRFIDKIRTYHKYRIDGQNVPLQYCFKGIKKDKTSFDVEIMISEIKNRDGKVTGTRNYFWDVTHREKIKHDLKLHKAQLELITKILRHDLINNFSAIRSGVRIYKRTKTESMLDAIISKTESGVHLIQQMRELEGFLSSDENLRYKSTDKIFAEVICNFPELEILTSGKANILVDSGIFSLFQNLINNSIIHGKADVIKLEITNKTGFCNIIYRDNGTGIDDKHREHIFKMNYTSKKSEHSGLGLYIVTKLIERYEGGIKLGDNDNGANIILTFRCEEC